MLRGPIEEKVKAKTNGRPAMQEFIKKILQVEEAGKQYMAEYRTGVKSAVIKEEQMGRNGHAN